MRKKAFELVLAVYRVTRRFPEGEVLIGQMRQNASQILVSLISGQDKEAIKQIEILLEYLGIGQAQNWLKEINFVILKKEYQILLDIIRQSGHNEKEVSLAKNEKFKVKGLNQRQRKILEYVGNFDRFQMKDLVKFFPKLSNRTLRRDLDKLSLKGHLEKSGQGRWTFYKTTGY